MARCELFLTKLPLLGQDPRALAALPPELDRRILLRALADKTVPTVSVAVSNRLGELERTLERLRAFGGDGYVYEEASPLEQVTAAIGAKLGELFPEGKRAPAPAPAQPRRQKPKRKPARGPQQRESAAQVLRELPWWRMAGGAASVLMMLGLAYALSRIDSGLDELGDGHGRSQSEERAEAERVAHGPQPKSGQPADAEQTQARERTPARTASDQGPAPERGRARVAEQVASTRSHAKPQLGALAGSAARELGQEAQREAIVLLPMLLGVMCARWLVRGVLGYVRGERPSKATWAVALGSLALAVGAAAALTRPARHALAGARPGDSKQAAQAARATASAKRRAALVKLLGEHTAVALLESSAAPSTEATSSQALAHTPASVQRNPPLPARPFTGLLAELRRRKQARDAASAAASQAEMARDKEPEPEQEREFKQEREPKQERELKQERAAVAKAPSSEPNHQRADTASTDRPASNGATDDPSAAMNAASATAALGAPSSAATSAVAAALTPGGPGSNPSGAVASSAAAAPPSSAPRSGSMAAALAAQRAPAKARRLPTALERGAYAFAGGFCFALLVYGMRFVARARAALACWLTLSLWAGARVGAQQVGRAPIPAPPEAVATGAALSSVLVRCMEQEAGSVTTEERALVAEFGPELATELASATAPLACGAGKLAEPSCADAVRALRCEQLATPLLAAGYDKLAEQRIDPALREYARALAERSVGCALGSDKDEAAQIATDVMASRLEVALGSAALMGSCRVRSEASARCATTVRQTPCEELLGGSDERVVAQSLIGLCAELLSCAALDAGSAAAKP
jgi:hypothetical protein